MGPSDVLRMTVDREHILTNSFVTCMSPVDADANFAFLDMLWYETVYIINNIRRLHCYLQRTTLGINVSLWVVSMRFTRRKLHRYLKQNHILAHINHT